MAKPSILVMLGTDEATRGGISAVVTVLRRQGLFERWYARYVVTHREGPAWRKAVAAWRAWLTVVRLMAAGRIRLLHVHTASGPSFWRKSLFVGAARIAGVPYILHVHGGGFRRFYEQQCGPLRRRWVRHVLRRSTTVLALSQDWHDAFAEMAPGCRCVVVPNAVEIPARSASLLEGRPKVVFMGQISEAKGVADLALAWPGVLEAVPQAQLVLAGVGDTERLRELFDAGGCGESVHFAGWVSGAEKEALLHSAWLLVLPSHIEALPMVVLEGMAAGVPVVASRVGGVPSAVANGETGLLIEPRDVTGLRMALVALLTDGERRLSFGAAARRRAIELFSAETQARRIEEVWREAGVCPRP